MTKTRWWIDAMHRTLSYQHVDGTEAEHMQDFWQQHRMSNDRCIECGHALSGKPTDPCQGCGVDWLGDGTYIEPGFRGSFDKKRDYRRKPG